MVNLQTSICVCTLLEGPYTCREPYRAGRTRNDVSAVVESMLLKGCMRSWEAHYMYIIITQHEGTILCRLQSATQYGCASIPHNQPRGRHREATIREPEGIHACACSLVAVVLELIPPLNTATTMRIPRTPLLPGTSRLHSSRCQGKRAQLWHLLLLDLMRATPITHLRRNR